MSEETKPETVFIVQWGSRVIGTYRSLASAFARGLEWIDGTASVKAPHWTKRDGRWELSYRTENTGHQWLFLYIEECEVEP
jgi:hypothetical protein